MLTILSSSLKYEAFFLVKLVFYCVVIDNYYLCLGAVPKVAKNFFKQPLGQEMAPLHGCILFFGSI